jgi:hypothetical protein
VKIGIEKRKKELQDLKVNRGNESINNKIEK